MVRGIFFGILILSFFACGRHAPKDEAQPVKRNFGVTIPDGRVALPDGGGLLKSELDQPGAPSNVEVKSRDWLELADQLMETGSVVGGAFGRRLLQSGHDLSRAFYSYANSHTVMTGISNPVANPWVEAAHGYGMPVIVKNLKDSVESAEKKVKSAARLLHVSTAGLGANVPPENLIQRIIDGLRGFREDLDQSKDGTCDLFIDQITSSIDEKYLKDLETLRDNSKLDHSRPLSDSLRTLQSTLEKLPEVTDEDRRRLLIQVREGVNLATRAESLKGAPAALELLIDFWRAKDIRADVPPSVRGLLSNLSDKDILALATMNKSQIYPVRQWNLFSGRTDYNLVPDRQMVALYLKNNGAVVSPERWKQLQAGPLAALQKILNAAEVQQFVNDYSVDDPADPDDAIFVIVNNWLNLSGRISYPDQLKTAFGNFTDQDLSALGFEPTLLNGTFSLVISGHEKLAAARYELLSGIEAFANGKTGVKNPSDGVRNFKEFFEEGIRRATRSRMDNALLPIAEDLARRLESAILPSLDEKARTADQISSDTYRIYSRYYVGKFIFGAPVTKGSLDHDLEDADNKVLAQYPLPLLEKQTLKLKKEGDNFTDLATDDETSADVLALGLLNNVERLKTFQPYENLSFASRGAAALAYQMISKLMVLGGYKGYDSRLVPSLAVPLTPGHFSDQLDLRHYDPDKIVFAAPEKMIIQNQYRLDPSSRQDPLVSVRGQMDLLRAYSKIMSYFKPWHASSFDLGLGALRIDEEPELKIFDRDDYFLLSLGLSAVILKNIPVKMLGLVTDKNQFVESSRLADPQSVQAIGAVLSDYTATRSSPRIGAEGMARGILALSEFYEQIEDLNRSTNPTIVDALKGEPLQKALTDIRKLVSGLIVFSTGRLMQSDGGFAVSFDGDSMTVSKEPRRLRDQLLMEKALLEAGRIFDSEFMKAKAVENLFFLNSHFWNTRLGFYNEVEKSAETRVNLFNVALALENASRIRRLVPRLLTQSPNLQKTSTQLDQLMNLWQRRFLTDTLDQSPVKEVFEFSL